MTGILSATEAVLARSMHLAPMDLIIGHPRDARPAMDRLPTLFLEGKSKPLSPDVSRLAFNAKVRATQGYDSIDPKYLHRAARVGRALREALAARDAAQ